MSAPVVREIHICAPPETVFAFFVEADKLTRWLASEATLDARPGGANVQVHAGGADRLAGPLHMEGRFVTIDPPHRVVFSWGFREPDVGLPPESTTVEVVFTPEAGGTRVRLSHHDLPPTEIANHTEGWTHMLKQLDAAVTGQALRVEHWVAAMPADVYEALSTRTGLDAWWGPVVELTKDEIAFDHGLGEPLRWRILKSGPEGVVWECTSHHAEPGNPASEWTGTRLEFTIGMARDLPNPDWMAERLELDPDATTVIRLAHTGWPADAQWLGFCTKAWADTLQLLGQSVAESTK